MGDLTSVLQESFSGIRVVKAFVAENKEIKRLNTLMQKLLSMLIKVY